MKNNIENIYVVFGRERKKRGKLLLSKVLLFLFLSLLFVVMSFLIFFLAKHLYRFPWI